jgi:MFS family permease
MNLSIYLLGATWGGLYLVQVQNLSALQASYVTSMIYIGTIIGGPLVGSISDRIGMRRSPMIAGAILTFFLLLTLFCGQLSLLTLMLIFFLLGLVSSTQVLSYPTVAENNSEALSATAVSAVSISCIGGGAIFPYYFGLVMSWHWDGLMKNGIPFYSLTNFHHALFILPFTCVIAFLAIFWIKETFCKRAITV